MFDITIEDLEDWEIRELRARAARNGRSLEDEARTILLAGLAEPSDDPTELNREPPTCGP